MSLFTIAVLYVHWTILSHNLSLMVLIVATTQNKVFSEKKAWAQLALLSGGVEILF